MAATGTVRVKLTADTTVLARQLAQAEMQLARVGDSRHLRRTESILSRELTNAPLRKRPLLWLARLACRDLLEHGWHYPGFRRLVRR